MWLIVRSRPDRQVVAIHKGGLILPGFSAIIGLPNAHFVNLFVGDSRTARFSSRPGSRCQDDLELDCAVEVPHEKSSLTQTTRSPTISANKTRVNRTNVLTSFVSLKPTEGGKYDARCQRHGDATGRDEPYHYRGAQSLLRGAARGKAAAHQRAPRLERFHHRGDCQPLDPQ